MSCSFIVCVYSNRLCEKKKYIFFILFRSILRFKREDTNQAATGFRRTAHIP